MKGLKFFKDLFKNEQTQKKLDFIEEINLMHLNLELSIDRGHQYMKLEDVKAMLEHLGNVYANER